MSVTLDGVKETLRAMRKIDPELLKEMNKEIKGIMIPIRDKAREYAPTAAPGGLYNWDEGKYTRKITARNSAFRTFNSEGRVRRFPLYQGYREETAVGGHHAHRFGVGGRGHVMVGRDDAVGRDGEAGGERVVPLRALVALVGGADEHGRLGSATIDLRPLERRARGGAGGEADRVGAGTFALFQPRGAADGDIAFLRQGVGLLLQLAEQLAIIRRAVDVDAGDRRGAEDAGREQRGEKHAGIEADERRETRQSMRIRREHTGGWRTCDGKRGARAVAARG